MGCTASSEIGGEAIGLAFQLRSIRDEDPDKSVLDQKSSGSKQDSQLESWDHICTASCRPGADTLTVLPRCLSGAAFRPNPPLENEHIDDEASENDIVEAFASRRWISFPEKQFDLSKLHPPLSPFLGSMYWTAATPKPAVESLTPRRNSKFPSLVTPSTAASSTVTKFGIQDFATPPREGKKCKHRLTLDTSCSTEWSGSISSASENENDMSMNSPKRNAETSREILDYSAIDESYSLHVPADEGLAEGLDEKLTTPLTSRRLFQEDENDAILCMTPSMDKTEESDDSSSPLSHEQHFTPHSACHFLSAPPKQRSATNSSLSQVRDGPLQFTPNVATFIGAWGSKRERQVSTLPSQVEGKPIKLRVIETDTGGCSASNHGDFFSYDPYFSSGRYEISTTNGQPYGDGLFMKMGTKFMTLEDLQGNILAVIKSRYTFTPSHIVYAPKPRIVGQAPSGHRLTNTKDGSVVDGDGSIGVSADLYPWALIQKEGRTMEDDATVHLIGESSRTLQRIQSGGSTGLFNSNPAFRGRHGFDCELHTHTVVSRAVYDEYENGPVEEVPCCVIVRDPSNLDVVDITIAPGIDPLLMICYLASHSKMDVEPILGGY